ncbi:MAG: hypothetical protein D6784_08120 [Chloroflexi bacterium]|nr:MAG: hypothetical protein D6784_08120 [Chloroflexota bacterium]
MAAAVLLFLAGSLLFVLQAQAQEGDEAPEGPIPGEANLVQNGNFEYGFYTVPELGFEPPDVGHVPNHWQWFRNEKYGKYNIYNNEGFGLVCPDDLSSETSGKNSLSIHIQSTDESDARLGVYQTVPVTPGVDYLFSISGTIQVQPGGSSPDINHHMLVYFDHTGNTDWRAIPHEKWIRIPWKEQELEFEVSGPNDPDLAQVEDYYQVVRAKSDKLTIFLMAWRRWANWRTGIFTLDCVSLVPLSEVDVEAILPRLSDLSAPTVDAALGQEPAVQPAAATQPGPSPDSEPSGETAIIPPSGGILEKESTAWLVGAAAVLVIAGLVAAGVWNSRRS